MKDLFFQAFFYINDKLNIKTNNNNNSNSKKNKSKLVQIKKK